MYMNDTNSVRITIKDASAEGVRVDVYLEKYKRKHWWSLKRSWCITGGCGARSDDRDKHIQECLVEWTTDYPGIEIINTSTRIKFSPDLLTRKILIEKISNGKTGKPKPIKPKKVVCVDDGTLYCYEVKYNDGTTEITAGKKYWSWEHHSDEDRLETFDKFLYVRNNLGKRHVYPKRFFKEI